MVFGYLIAAILGALAMLLGLLLYHLLQAGAEKDPGQDESM